MIWIIKENNTQKEVILAKRRVKLGKNGSF